MDLGEEASLVVKLHHIVVAVDSRIYDCAYVHFYKTVIIAQILAVPWSIQLLATSINYSNQEKT